MNRAVSIEIVPKQGHVPGEVGVWVFVFGDMLVFALLFFTYLYYRSLDLSLYVVSQAKLNAGLGLVNTITLLASSWAVVAFMRSLRSGQKRRAKWFLLGAIVCGCVFVGIKYFEYGAKLAEGLTLFSNDFFMYYYVLTGIHLIHVVVGIAGLLFTYFAVIDSPDIKTRNTYAECAVTYWHMVDLLWLFLFPLLYLIRT